jgi:hypothetical protein
MEEILISNSTDDKEVVFAGMRRFACRSCILFIVMPLPENFL